MQFRDHPAVEGKRDFYPIDPRKLKVDPSYNVRDLTTPDAKAHIAYLKASIIANGVRAPLEVRLDGNDIYIVAGHCRHAAVMSAIEDGHDIKTIPAIPEAKGTNEIERTLNLVVSNSGEPLKPLEVAQVVKRLADYGWSEGEIGKRIGWKSVSSVKQHLEMLEMPADVQRMVKRGDVSATTAVLEVRKNGTKAVSTLRAAKERAGKAGKAKVTAKTMNSGPSRKTLLGVLAPFALIDIDVDAQDDQKIEVEIGVIRRAAQAYQGTSE